MQKLLNYSTNNLQLMIFQFQLILVSIYFDLQYSCCSLDSESKIQLMNYKQLPLLCVLNLLLKMIEISTVINFINF